MQEPGLWKTPRIQCPITIQIMTGINSVLEKNYHIYHSITMWLACCLGFLCSIEFTVPSQEAFDIHLLPTDLAIDNESQSSAPHGQPLQEKCHNGSGKNCIHNLSNHRNPTILSCEGRPTRSIICFPGWENVNKAKFQHTHGQYSGQIAPQKGSL